jgi:hypothetical protein
MMHHDGIEGNFVLEHGHVPAWFCPSPPSLRAAQGGFVCCVQNASLTPPRAEFIPVQLDLSTVPFVLTASRLYDDDCLNSPQNITSYILTHRLSDKRSCSV